jgi:hypothetical protein
MSNTVQVLEGVGKRLEVHPDRIVIERTDLLARFLPMAFNGREVAYYHEISRVSFNEGAHLRLGEDEESCIQLVITRHDHHSMTLRIPRHLCEEARQLRALIAERLTPEYLTVRHA